jgi:DMSO/TMAO reductase YedYZ molybdopterin-dependent catalytic subunit
MAPDSRTRRAFLRIALTSVGGALLAGCDALSRSKWFPKVLSAGEHLSSKAHHWAAPRKSMAQEFTEADLSPFFRSNGTANPNDATYQALAQNNFVDWRLRVDGRVERPMEFSLAQLRAMPSRTQITRHDCVEGWSAIGKWKGVPLAAVLDLVKPAADARYVVFRCADPMDADGTKYYESVDMEDAYHPQTILAYDLNDHTLPIANGAPLRVRIERQLGYKMAKYIMRIELVDTFAHIGGGKGGYWEDGGYEWYAGI